MHPSAQQTALYREVEMCRSFAPYQYKITWYGPLGRCSRLCVRHEEARVAKGELSRRQ